MITRRTRALAGLALTVLLGLGAGCTNLPGFLQRHVSASPAPSAEAPIEQEGEAQPIQGQVGNVTATVHIKNMAFSPSQVTLSKGGSVTFVNDDAMPHSVVPRSGAQFTASSVFNEGEQVTITFSAAGAQPYACGVHPSMTGTVTVQE